MKRFAVAFALFATPAFAQTPPATTPASAATQPAVDPNASVTLTVNALNSILRATSLQAQAQEAQQIAKPYLDDINKQLHLAPAP